MDCVSVKDAWDALIKAKTPSELANSPALRSARERVNKEVSRCQAAPPKFSKDGRVALVRITSDCQVHPVIATRWAGTLKSAKKLVAVIVSYTSSFVSESLRKSLAVRERRLYTGYDAFLSADSERASFAPR
jgi:hypothetical protein